VRCEVLTALSVKITVFSDVMPTGTKVSDDNEACLCSRYINLLTWRSKQYIPPALLYPYTTLYGVMTHNTVISSVEICMIVPVSVISAISHWFRVELLRTQICNWRIKNQLDATYYFIVLLIGSTCFGHYYAHHQELATVMLITTLVVSFLVCCRLELGAVRL